MAQQRRQYDLMRARPGSRVRFTLSEDLTAGGSAAAVIRVWNGSSLEDTELAIEVHEVQNKQDGTTGQHGRAEWVGDARRWELYGCLGDA